MAAIRDNLIAYWPFDETSGIITADLTTNANPGVLHNFPTNNSQWVTGVIGHALQFRGPAFRDYVRVANYPKPLTNISVAAWVWADARPNWASIAKNWGGGAAGQFHFGFTANDGDLSCYLGLSTGATPSQRELAPFPVGKWQHVAFTADGRTLKIYRNGAQVGSVAYFGGLVASPLSAVGIGVKLDDAGLAPDSGAPGYWQGKMDDLGIWNRALNTAEISDIVTAGLQGRSLTNAESQPVITGGGLRISEFMASNDGFLLDDFGEASDWIELHNDTPATVNLDGWFLTDNPNKLTQWPFPATNMPPGSFLLVFASGRDRRVPGTTLHTNFKLDAAGEYLALVRPDRSVATAFTPLFPIQVPDASFGFSIVDGHYESQAHYFSKPSPGGPNGFGSSDLGPVITLANHSPDPPATNYNLNISCRVSRTMAPVGEVTLNWRVMYGRNNQTRMFDDGQHGDGTAGDGIYGAAIDHTNCFAGQMIRWFINASDTEGRVSRWPLISSSPDSAEYLGAVVQPEALANTALPVLHWFVENPAAADTDSGTRCSLFYANRFYDNLIVRIRGGTSRNWPKKSYKFEMNSGDRFFVREDLPWVSEFDLNATYTDKSYVRSVLAAEQQSDAGLPVMDEFHLHVRRNNQFFSVAIYVEQPNEDFLTRHGLDPNGALYKALGDPVGVYEKKNSALRRPIRSEFTAERTETGWN